MIRLHALVTAVLVTPLMLPMQSSAADTTSAELMVDPGQRFARAQRHKDDGDHDAALRELSSLREEFPLDVDYALARAQVLARLGRNDEALDELIVATELVPDYEDIWKLRFSILLREQSSMAKEDRSALQQEAAERFPDAQWWHSPPDDKWTLLVGASRDSLSNDQPSWNSQFTELQLTTSDVDQYRVWLRRDERFAGADLTVGFGAEHSWTSNWFAGMELLAAGNPNFQPELGYAGHVGKSLTNGWVVDLRYRQREYAAVSVASTIATVEKYFNDFRVAYGLGISRLQSAASLPNHVLTANWFYDESASVGITINSGREAEAIAIGQVLETDVSGVSLSGRRDLGDRFGLQWWLGVHKQGDYYRRRFLGLAVSYRL